MMGHTPWIEISHAAQWEPADLPINAAGDTRPGFRCTHQLENGRGQCGGNVFDLADAVGDHVCIVEDPYPEMDKLAQHSTHEIDLLMGLLTWLEEHEAYSFLDVGTHADRVYRYLGIDPVKLAAERALCRQRMLDGTQRDDED